MVGKLFPLTASDTCAGYLQAHKDLFLCPSSATSSAQSHSPEPVNSSSVAAAAMAAASQLTATWGLNLYSPGSQRDWHDLKRLQGTTSLGKGEGSELGHL